MPIADFSALNNAFLAAETYLKEATDVRAITDPIVDRAGLESALRWDWE